MNPKAARMEIRFPDAAGNPYLTFASMLMAGIDGIKNKIDPGKPFDQDLYDFKFVRGLKNTNGQMSLGVSGGFDDSNDNKISYKYRIFF